MWPWIASYARDDFIVLDVLQQIIGAGEFHLAGRVFDADAFDDAVVNDHAVALGANAEPATGRIEREAERLGEVGAAVGQELDLAFRTGCFLSGVHDEHIVDRGDRDGVDALGLDGVGVLDEAGHVILVAGRREGAGHREQYHLLALENVVTCLRRRPVRRHGIEGCGGHAVADADRHDSLPLPTVG